MLDTAPDERFDRLTRSAVEQLHVPISTVSIIDADREWFKSCAGTETSEGSRENSFCGHTIMQGHIFIIEDTRQDPRFADNPQVIASPFIRFYAGVTLHDRKTHQPVGAFCVKDIRPRSLTVEETGILLSLARSAEEALNTPAKKQ